MTNFLNQNAILTPRPRRGTRRSTVSWAALGLAAALGTTVPAPRATAELFVPPEVFVDLYLAAPGPSEAMMAEVRRALLANPTLAANVAAQAIRLRPDLERFILFEADVTREEAAAARPVGPRVAEGAAAPPPDDAAAASPFPPAESESNTALSAVPDPAPPPAEVADAPPAPAPSRPSGLVVRRPGNSLFAYAPPPRPAPPSRIEPAVPDVADAPPPPPEAPPPVVAAAPRPAPPVAAAPPAARPAVPESVAAVEPAAVPEPTNGGTPADASEAEARKFAALTPDDPADLPAPDAARPRAEEAVAPSSSGSPEAAPPPAVSPPAQADRSWAERMLAALTPWEAEATAPDTAEEKMPPDTAADVGGTGPADPVSEAAPPVAVADPALPPVPAPKPRRFAAAPAPRAAAAVTAEDVLDNLKAVAPRGGAGTEARGVIEPASLSRRLDAVPADPLPDITRTEAVIAALTPSDATVADDAPAPILAPRAPRPTALPPPERYPPVEIVRPAPGAAASGPDPEEVAAVPTAVEPSSAPAVRSYRGSGELVIIRRPTVIDLGGGRGSVAAPPRHVSSGLYARLRAAAAQGDGPLIVATRAAVAGEPDSATVIAYQASLFRPRLESALARLAGVASFDGVAPSSLSLR